MSDMDLSFFLEPPERTVSGKIVIEALKPLSMTTAQPGTYYRSRPAPTKAMLYGMLENALGWHFHEDVRKELLKGLRKQAKKKLGRGHELKKTPWITGDEDRESGVGFKSLLQHHLKFTEPHFEPVTVHFDDLWARHVHGNSTRFPGGSRYSDYHIERVVNLEKRGTITFTDSAKKKCDIQKPEQLSEVKPGDKVHKDAIRPHFPMYYDSPTPREYVIPKRPYQYRAEATPTVAKLIGAALDDPAAPLYLGTNDGWVNARWEAINE